ncbi:MAG: tetratricopeptide repeat protein [Hoeflea sp.]|uniref:tetratricopeptide repeat protein n=1 Tax=Hoeflea sp. TaxID=1940281 RepID=UPI001DA4EC66|nr:tetratricopeptide repeat protein [Hoeflea sp.]MBU4527675.1 tetratricopeptide repeat protein [Alphaproteobacteria bacterium]MBU4546457.1 tetratricopeptide repeat protein [Alphaproteobacteria bacterium]MBU4553025.1 tetratricopeptide repeat protein [Alphaproteobacteria bacterium]MBV1724097.1 tetratricopeptide repeat protein [Hoeflea sp.]MBV1759782.1 tetratricopeptide repeat protein [Hoeflea sp.]
MADDNSTFIREVNDDIRSDYMKALWRRFRYLIFGVAIGIVAFTAGLRGWQYWQETTAARSGDVFLAALEKARTGDADAALAEFQELEQTGYGSYPVLARMRAATVMADKGDTAAAIAAFSAIGRDTSQPVAIRDAARLRAAYLLVDHGSYADVSAEVEVLAVPGNPARHSARDALGIAAFKAGELSQASQWFGDIAADNEAPNGVKTRAGLMLDMIAAQGGAS